MAENLSIRFLRRKNNLKISLFLLLIFSAFLPGNENMAAQASAKSFELDLKVPSLHKVKLSWNKVKGAKGYIITRTECKDSDEITPGPVNKKSLRVMAELPENRLAYQDKTVKKGKYYRYRVKAVLASGKKSASNIAHIAVQDAYWTEDMTNMVSPEKIRMSIGFNENPWPRIAPEGIEVYRGTSYQRLKKYQTVRFRKKSKKEAYPSVEYADTGVMPGQSYYYQAKPFAMIKGKKVYGLSTIFLRQSAILPAGDYSAEVSLPVSGQALTVSLSGNTKGNAEIDFIENQFWGLVDLLCRKEDGTYDTVSLKLQEYQIDGGGWQPFEGQDMRLEGDQRITFRFVPYLEGEMIPAAVNDYSSAELLFRLRYEDDERDLHINVKENQAFLTDVGKTAGVTYLADEFDLWHLKKNKKTKKVAEAVLRGYFRGSTANYDTGITASYTDYFEYDLKKRRIPDGVRIYRSTDNKTFTPVADLTYQDGFDQVRYEDPAVKPGEVYYYKAKNFVNTPNGKRFSASMKYSLTFYAQYSTCRYQMQSIGLQDGTVLGSALRSPMVFRLQGLSCGNAVLVLDSSATAEAVVNEKGEKWGYVMDERITAYSLDGITWEKMPQKAARIALMPKQMIYIKLEAEKGQNIPEDTSVSELEVSIPLQNDSGYQSCIYDFQTRQGLAYVNSSGEGD